MSGSGDGGDPWAALARFTPARIALGRAGVSLPTAEVLRFALAHARARDAVHAAFDADAIAANVRALGLRVAIVTSDAPDRETYLRRPDRGRRLAVDADLAGLPPESLTVVITDGLSATAVHAHATRLLAALHVRRPVSAVAIVRGGRVAIGDEIGERLGAPAVVVLVGERPGLSSPDSLGAYVTVAPRVGRTDAERNCVSNIRPEGLATDVAAFKIHWLLGEGLRRGLTGVDLKDESDGALSGPAPLELPGVPD